MIQEDTAAKIAYAYAEIRSAEELLGIIDKAHKNREAPDFRDAFGRHHSNLQLGVPSASGGHRLLDVSPTLAAIVIRAHIDAKRNEIAALCEVARVELER